MVIIRGTTPTIIFTFNDIKPADITACVLAVKQDGQTIINKSLSDAIVEADNISFTLTQAETLTITKYYSVTVVLDWLLTDGTRGRSQAITATVEDPALNAVLE